MAIDCNNFFKYILKGLMGSFHQFYYFGLNYENGTCKYWQRQVRSL
jgi:hypothetical protein